jgi:hypothetical protein
MASRTWVSGVGDDANPGSRTAPCKTFAGAISKTDPGGEIDVVDPGGFGALTITKALTIDGAGTFASVLASGTSGITVAAGPGDVVTLRNLSINGLGASGLDGIHFVSGAALHLESCVIFNFGRKGVFFEPTGGSRLFIKDCILRNNADPVNGGALLVSPQGGGSAVVSVDATRMEGNLFAIVATDGSTVAVRNSVAVSNANAGFVVSSVSGGPVVMNLEQCLVIESNATVNSAGVAASGAQAVIRISNVMVVSNRLGLFVSAGGSIISFGNNRIAGNGTDGAPTLTPGQK